MLVVGPSSVATSPSVMPNLPILYLIVYISVTRLRLPECMLGNKTSTALS